MPKFLLAICLVVGFLFADLGIDEKLGEMVPLDLKFINEEGKEVSIKDIMQGKPLLLTLNYYECAGICTPQLNDMVVMLERLDLKEGKDYKILTVSFAPEEGPDLAKRKKRNLLASMRREFNPDAWSFVVDNNGSAAKLAKAVGFKYEKVVHKDGRVDYTHGTAIIVLAPDGKITRYLPGIRQLPFDVKMAISEASNEIVGSPMVKALQLCTSYDPKAKKYIFAWEKVVGVVMSLMALGFFIWLVKSGRRKEKN